MKFTVVFKRGMHVVHTVRGERELSYQEITVGEAQDVPKIEQLLEKLTGLRVHIEVEVPNGW